MFCFIVMFCVLFVCKCVLYCRPRCQPNCSPQIYHTTSNMSCYKFRLCEWVAANLKPCTCEEGPRREAGCRRGLLCFLRSSLYWLNSQAVSSLRRRCVHEYRNKRTGCDTSTGLHTFRFPSVTLNVKVKVHPCRGTEALYRPHGPQGE